jgi:hypothetical protein
MAVTMKNAVFWDATRCGFCKIQCFGGIRHIHLHFSSLEDFSILNMEATHSSETSIPTRPTWRHISEDGILETV